MNAAGANQGPSQDTPHSLNASWLLALLQEKKKERRAPRRRRRGIVDARRFPSYVPFTPFGPLTEELAAS